MAEVKHTPLFIRDYGQPVELAAAECQFALLDAPDGAPVAYVYMPEDVAMFAAAPDLLEAASAIALYLGATDKNDWRGLDDDDAISMLVKIRVGDLRALRAALSKATTQQEGG